jgi:hypothetical protein
MVTERLTPMHVRDVQLDHGQLDTFDRVVQCNGRVGEGAGVEDGADRFPRPHPPALGLDPVDQLTLVVGLPEVELEAEVVRRLPAEPRRRPGLC